MRSRTQIEGIRALYTISELAEMAGISRFAMSRLLKSKGIETTTSGRTIYVTLVALKAALPDLWDRCTEVRNRDGTIEMVTDDGVDASVAYAVC